MSAHYIVTPVRNAVLTIDATIWSIVSQSGDIDIHYHIQDGGSTDGTVDKLRFWADRIEKTSAVLPSRIHFTFASEPDNGMYDAINKGFANMDIPQDAFMSWCNADDALWPGALYAVTQIGHSLPDTDWIMGWPSWFDDKSRFTAIERSPKYPQAILAAGMADGFHWPFVQQESTFWRKRLWEKAGGINISLKLAGDWDLWMRFAKFAPLTHVHRQLGGFYVRPGQQSLDMTTYRSEMKKILSQNSGQHELINFLKLGYALTEIPWAVERKQNDWQVTTRSSKRYARLVARIIRRLPVVPSVLIKFMYRFW